MGSPPEPSSAFASQRPRYGSAGEHHGRSGGLRAHRPLRTPVGHARGPAVLLLPAPDQGGRRWLQPVLHGDGSRGDRRDAGGGGAPGATGPAATEAVPAPALLHDAGCGLRLGDPARPGPAAHDIGTCRGDRRLHAADDRGHRGSSGPRAGQPPVLGGRDDGDERACRLRPEPWRGQRRGPGRGPARRRGGARVVVVLRRGGGGDPGVPGLAGDLMGRCARPAGDRAGEHRPLGDHERRLRDHPGRVGQPDPAGPVIDVPGVLRLVPGPGHRRDRPLRARRSSSSRCSRWCGPPCCSGRS